MKPFPVYTVLEAIRRYQDHIAGPPIPPAWLAKPYFDSPEAKQEAIEGLNRNIELLEKSGLLSTADQLKRILELVEKDAFQREIRPLFADVINRLVDECKRHVIMIANSDHARYFSNAQYFDSEDKAIPQVSSQFPSAAEDIGEAGKCLACGRATSCVMHLSRVLEVGLQALAKALGVSKKNDWGKYLKEIEDELTRRMKAAGARTADEQFYAEANSSFDFVRRAWRNPTMHVDRTYTVERAEDILISVRSFMRHLATKLQE
jgi:hypothetical protein